MKEENKVKLKIEKLKAHSDYYKWEISQYNLFFIGIIAILIAIYIPIMISLNSIGYTLGLGFVLIISLTFFHYCIKPFTKKSYKKIKDYSKKINRLYEELEV